MADKRGLTLQPLVANGIFVPGPQQLSCTVGGLDYYAGLGDSGEIIFEEKIFRSPSAFSVYVKRKQNPGRKADDGWTSVKYLGEPLSTYRQQLESLSGAMESSAPSGQLPLPPVPVSSTHGGRSKRKPRPKQALPDFSDDFDDNDAHPAEPSDLQTDTTVEEKECATAVTEHDDATDEPDDPSAVNLEHTWIQCEHSSCQKWRRVKYSEVPDGPWYCSCNSDPRFASCAARQELADEEIDKLMVEGAMARHVATSHRPSLNDCTATEFEVDLVSFLEARGDEQLATFLREHRITCNNIPLDVFGLYREVVRLGGLLANERYDDRGRWAGGINFAGEVFPRLKNWTAHNRATSVGNQLLNNYKKFLLHYEKAYLSVDLPHVARQVAAGRFSRPTVVPAAKPPKENTDPLAFLADVAGATCAGELLGGATAPTPEGGAPSSVPSWGSRKRRRMDESKPPHPVSSQQHYRRRGDLGETTTGQLLLAQDDRGRQWAVAVADVADLPVNVAEGGMAGEGAAGMPSSLQAASTSGRKPAAVPVLVLGTSWLGWVARSCCHSFTVAAGNAAIAEAWASAGGEGLGGSEAGGWGGEGGDAVDASLLVCVRGLREAVQYCSTSGTSAPGARAAVVTVPAAWVQAASCSHIARRLLSLESQIPLDALSCCNHSFWAQWRSCTEAASHPSTLSSQLLTLAYQIQTTILKRGAQDAYWGGIQAACGMVGGRAGEKRGPTLRSVDDAVQGVVGVLDWGKIRKMWVGEKQGGSREEGVKRVRTLGVRVRAEGGESLRSDGMDLEDYTHDQKDGASATPSGTTEARPSVSHQTNDTPRPTSVSDMHRPDSSVCTDEQSDEEPQGTAEKSGQNGQQTTTDHDDHSSDRHDLNFDHPDEHHAGSDVEQAARGLGQMASVGVVGNLGKEAVAPALKVRVGAGHWSDEESIDDTIAMDVYCKQESELKSGNVGGRGQCGTPARSSTPVTREEPAFNFQGIRSYEQRR